MRFSSPMRTYDVREIHRQSQNLARTARSQVIEVDLTPDEVPADSTRRQEFTVTGVPSNSQVVVNPPAMTNGIVIAYARVKGKNEVQIAFTNVTAGALTPNSGTYQVRVLR